MKNIEEHGVAHHENSAEATKRLSKRKTVYLFGQPITHSVSPTFHNSIFQELGLPWRYLRLDSQDPEDLVWVMQETSFVGAAITMPNKMKSMAHVDVLSEHARKIGCINTVFTRKSDTTSCRPGSTDPWGRARVCIGTNTDWIGIRDALLRGQPDIGQSLEGRPAMVIGGGATCRSAVYALTNGLGANTVYLVNRFVHEVDAVIEHFHCVGMKAPLQHLATVEQAQGLNSPPAVIISAIPDHEPVTDLERTVRAIAATVFEKTSGPNNVFLEMCYDPSPKTALVRLASQSGWQVVTGIDVMTYQAIAQSVLWTEKNLEDLPLEAATEAMKDVLVRRGILV